jgi:hypothetical protein
MNFITHEIDFISHEMNFITHEMNFITHEMKFITCVIGFITCVTVFISRVTNRFSRVFIGKRKTGNFSSCEKKFGRKVLVCEANGALKKPPPPKRWVDLQPIRGGTEALSI